MTAYCVLAETSGFHPTYEGAGMRSAAGELRRDGEAVAADLMPLRAITRSDNHPYSGPKLAQARKSAPIGSLAPKSVQALGRKRSSSGRLCM